MDYFSLVANLLGDVYWKNSYLNNIWNLNFEICLWHQCRVLPVEQSGQLEADNGMGASQPIYDRDQCTMYAILILKPPIKT